MDKIQQEGIITLIKSALYGKDYKLPANFEIGEVVEYAKKSQISEMIYCGAINCGVSSETAAMRELFIHACNIISLNHQQKIEYHKICGEFDKNGVEYMPLKGVLLKQVYPKSSMRFMSDIDILIKTEQYAKIEQILLDLGYTPEEESNHELPWRKKNIYLELHKRLISTYNKDFYRYFGDGWDFAKPSSEMPNRYEMSLEDVFIYLFTHLVKHYRSGGIGVKHMTDLWVYLKAYPDLNQKYIEVAFNKMMLLDFYKNVMRTLNVWFGDGKGNDITNLITYVIFKSGAYGNYDDRLAALVIRDFKTEDKKHNRVRELWEMFFPPYKKMCDKYPFLRKAGILLPVMWIYRDVVAIFSDSRKIKNIKKNIDVIAKDKVSLYHKSLQKVGLDYNFEEH